MICLKMNDFVLDLRNATTNEDAAFESRTHGNWEIFYAVVCGFVVIVVIYYVLRWIWRQGYLDCFVLQFQRLRNWLRGRQIDIVGEIDVAGRRTLAGARLDPRSGARAPGHQGGVGVVSIPGSSAGASGPRFSAWAAARRGDASGRVGISIGSPPSGPTGILNPFSDFSRRNPAGVGSVSSLDRASNVGDNPTEAINPFVETPPASSSVDRLRKGDPGDHSPAVLELREMNSPSVATRRKC